MSVARSDDTARSKVRNMLSHAFYATDLAAGQLKGARCPNCDAPRGRVAARKRLQLATVYDCLACGLYYRATGLQGTGFARWYYTHLYTDLGIATNPRALPREELFAWAQRAGKDRRALVSHLLAGLSGPVPWIAVLGASWGYEVMLLETLGLSAWGVEAAEDRRDFGRRHYGVDLVASFQEGIARHGQGGVIVSSHVLEHIARLSEFMHDLVMIAAPVAQLHITPRVEPLGPQTASLIGREHPIGLTTAFWERLQSAPGNRRMTAFHAPPGDDPTCPTELVAVSVATSAVAANAAFDFGAVRVQP